MAIELFRGLELPSREVEPAYRSLARFIRELITSGQLRPGDLLPARTTLAATLRVSLHTVRQAYRVLLREVLVVGGQGERLMVAGGRGHPRGGSDPTAHPPSGNEHSQLRGVVRAIHSNGSDLQLVLEIAEPQQVLVSTSRTAIEWLGLQPGHAATVSIRASDVLLTRGLPEAG